MSKRTADLCINARWVIPIEGTKSYLERHSVLIKGGYIIAIEPQNNRSFSAKKNLDLPHHALLPGWINAHGHAAMTLFRGMADDTPLNTWLEKHIWPAEKQWVNESFVQQGTELAIAEMILSGTTTFSDMYFYPEESIKMAINAGIRTVCFAPILDFPTAYADNADQYIDKAIQLHQKYQHNPLITVGFGPHAPYSVSDAPLQRIAQLSNQLNSPIQIHLHETSNEIISSLEVHNKRPIQRLADLNVLSKRVNGVHMTQVHDSDIQLLKKSQTSIIHCPKSNLKLSSGYCPIHRLQKENIIVGLGTDSAASNNRVDMLSELQTTALQAKAIANDAAFMSAHSALKMATLDSAKALGIDAMVGSLVVGKIADIQAVDLSDLCYQPLYNPISQLVYCGQSQHVTHVWIAGQCLLNNRRLIHMETEKISAQANHWLKTIHPKK